MLSFIVKGDPILVAAGRQGYLWAVEMVECNRGNSEWQVVTVVAGELQKERRSYLSVALGAKRKFVCGRFCP